MADMLQPMAANAALIAGDGGDNAGRNHGMSSADIKTGASKAAQGLRNIGRAQLQQTRNA